MLPRLIIGIPLGALVTLTLFTIMRLLITNTGDLTPEEIETITIDITRVERDETSDPDSRLPDRPTAEDQPPPPPSMDTSTARPDLGGFDISMPGIENNIGDVGNVGPIDGEIQPLVRVPPEYPVRAAERGMEGSSCVVFTVTPEGTVTDARVYESSSSIFDSASLRAIRRFRYQPRIVDGEAVPRPNVRFCFDFALETGRGRR